MQTSILPSPPSILFELWRALRPRQWLKNGFVLVPLFFAGSAADSSSLVRALLAAAIFSVVASGLYLWNDIQDRHDDRQDQKKRFRPVASGRLSVSVAATVSGLLLMIGLVGAFLLNATFGWIVSVYVVMTTLYTVSLKQLIVFDTLIIALGFLLRVLAGGAAVEVSVSSWLFITVTFLALLLATLKRRAEFVTSPQGGGRAVLSAYTPELFQHMISVATTGTLLSYALYTFSRSDGDWTRWSIFIVMYSVFRYLAVAFRHDQGGEPESLVVVDRPLLISIIVFVVYMSFVIYGVR